MAMFFGNRKRPVFVGHDGSLTLYEEDDDGNPSKPADPADVTPEEMAEFLNRRAESENRHDFVGSYSVILNLIQQCHDSNPVVIAHRVMHRLIQRGGLLGD